MKPVLSFAWTTVLFSFSPTSKPSCQRLLGGGHRLHHLEQRHHLGRVEEVQPQEAVGAGGGRGLVDHRERGGVGREERIFLDDPVDLGPHLELPIEVLGDRLDHQIAVGKIGVVRRSLDSPEDRVGVGLVDLALLDRPAELLLDPADPGGELLVGDLAHDHVPAGLGADLCDPVTHQARSEYSYLADRHLDFEPPVGAVGRRRWARWRERAGSLAPPGTRRLIRPWE